MKTPKVDRVFELSRPLRSPTNDDGTVRGGGGNTSPVDVIVVHVDHPQPSAAMTNVEGQGNDLELGYLREEVDRLRRELSRTRQEVWELDSGNRFDKK